jgi:hypothetical protein
VKILALKKNLPDFEIETSNFQISRSPEQPDSSR